MEHRHSRRAFVNRTKRAKRKVLFISYSIRMKRLFVLIFIVVSSIGLAFADYSSHGRPWDVDDNYDSSRGLWFVLFIVIVGIIVFLGAVAKNTWDNHKELIKEGLGIVAFFGVCILLFLGGKACSEQHPPNSNSTNTPQTRQVTPQKPLPQNQKQYQPQLRYRTEYYNETCPSCGGNRFIVCNYCGGKGFIKQTCQYCNGQGYKEVYKVVRSEIDPATWQEINPVYGYEKEYCNACFGHGYKEVKCTHCDNNYPYNVGMTSGHICSTCQGTGVVERSRQVPYYE